MNSTNTKGDSGSETFAKSTRLVSLDVFRGITIAGMILVNNPGSWGSVYPALEHAEWNGWTPTDLIYPFFLFIIGVAMPYSFSRRLESGATKPKLFLHVLVRSLILFALGMILTGLPDYNFSHKLILDVLQRIGIIYFFTGTIFLVTSVTSQAVVAIACLILYWMLMMLVPVPGYGAGVLAPVGNLWWYVDNVLLRGWHYHAEGILSLIPSISTVLAGTLTGHWLRTPRNSYEKVSALFVFGNFALVLGAILDMWFPINKLLWSSSYVVFTAGFALNLLGVCYWLIEIKGYKRWALPFVVFGMNAITVFFLSSLTARILELIKIGQVSLKSFLYTNMFAPWAGNLNGSLFYAIAYVLLWLGVMAVFYKKRIFIKI
ncbi:MAG: acyltransferase family protein [Bacteroidota bacterium]